MSTSYPNINSTKSDSKKSGSETSPKKTIKTVKSPQYRCEWDQFPKVLTVCRTSFPNCKLPTTKICFNLLKLKIAHLFRPNSRKSRKEKLD